MPHLDRKKIGSLKQEDYHFRGLHDVCKISQVLKQEDCHSEEGDTVS